MSTIDRIVGALVVLLAQFCVIGWAAAHPENVIAKCCPLGEYFVMRNDSTVRECVKQPLHFHNDIRRYNSFLREFEITFDNPCEG